MVRVQPIAIVVLLLPGIVAVLQTQGVGPTVCATAAMYSVQVHVPVFLVRIVNRQIRIASRQYVYGPQVVERTSNAVGQARLSVPMVQRAPPARHVAQE